MKKIVISLICLFVLVGCSTTKEDTSNEEITQHFNELGWEFTTITSSSSILENTKEKENEMEWIDISYTSNGVIDIRYGNQTQSADLVDKILIKYSSDLQIVRNIVYSEWNEYTDVDSCTYNFNEKDTANSSATICKKEMIEPKREEMEERFDKLLEALDISKERLAEWIEWYCIQEGWINEKEDQ